MRNKLLAFCLLAAVLLFPVAGYADTIEATLGAMGSDGNYRWIVDGDGHLRPGTTETYNLGSASYVIDTIYVDELVVSGSAGSLSVSSISVSSSLGVCGTTELSGETTIYNADFGITSTVNDCYVFRVFKSSGNVSIYGDLSIGDQLIAAGIATGTDQADAGAVAGEVYADSDDGYTLKLGQ